MGRVVADAGAELLERDAELAILRDCLAVVRREAGGLVVTVGGEAGVGKTALLRRFRRDSPEDVRFLWGTCDALFTPRPLGPFGDISEATGGELERLVHGEARAYEVAAELLAELRLSRTAVLVLEDLHAADEATLDVVRLLARRVEGVPALVLLSYRNDELERDHPLRVVLGDLASGAATRRVVLSPLSVAAVARLAESTPVDPDDLYRKTSGNPFFVTEALATGADEIPVTVRDAVLARAARLSDAGRSVLDAVAVVPPQAELWLLESLIDIAGLEECLGSGMLASDSRGAAFRHELARLAVENALSDHRRIELNRSALRVLKDPPHGPPDLARLAHHAEAAGDADAVLDLAPAAGARAASLGAKREAAAQYARALRFADDLDAQGKGDLLEHRAQACYLIGDFDESMQAQLEAVECHRLLGDRRLEGNSLWRLSRLLRYVGRPEEAMEVARNAVTVLEPLAPGHELALAYCNLSHLHMHLEDAEQAIAWADRALALADELDDAEARVYALTNVANAESLVGETAKDELERSFELADAAGLDEHAGRALIGFAWWSARGRRYTTVDSDVARGLDYCNERGLELWRLFLLAAHARSQLDRGRWDDAVDSAEPVLRNPRSSPVTRVVALSVLGLVRARRGDPGVWDALDEAWELALPTGELQRIEPAAAARAEAGWLEDRVEIVAEATDPALDLAVGRGAWWIVGELLAWRARAGLEATAPDEVPEPWRSQLAGDRRRAAALWADLDSPYEAALALGDDDEDDALRRGLAGLQALGAAPAAAMVARRMRERGMRNVARGPRATTKENPAGLTRRELEVLGLLAEGLRNREIAERLVLAPKTVDHHVTSILRKLDAPTRGQAAAEARRRGFL